MSLLDLCLNSCCNLLIRVFLKVFMQDLRFLDFYMSNDPKLQLELRKLAKILGCLKFGIADGPRVRGGLSAIHETCSPEALQRSCQPQKFIADSPPKDRGRSAHVWAEAVSVSCSVKNFKGGRSAKGPRTVRDWTELWGRPDLTYIGCLPHLPTKPNTTPKVSLSFSLKHVGKTTRSSPFGVVPGRSEHIPGLFSR